jgi:predicted tellurium resistance membrane protein TerC
VQRPKTLFVIPLNAVLFSMLLYALFFSLRNLSRMPAFLQLLVSVVLLYIALSLLVSAYTRMFTVAVPLLLFWFAWVLSESVPQLMRNRHDADAIR